MSQKTVQFIIGRLITDEEYRLRFLAEPRGTLMALRDQGFELTAGEINALIRTDPAFWMDAAAGIDPQLQRCRLHED